MIGCSCLNRDGRVDPGRSSLEHRFKKIRWPDSPLVRPPVLVCLLFRSTTMLATRKHPILFAAVLFALSIFFYHQTVIAPILHWTPDRPTAGHFDWNGPANATLGFNAIIVVSGPGSPRRSRLIQASNVTEIDLTIPDQPQWTEQDIKNFTDALAWGGRETGRGSTLAWLSHHHVLQWYVPTRILSRHLELI